MNNHVTKAITILATHKRKKLITLKRSITKNKTIKKKLDDIAHSNIPCSNSIPNSKFEIVSRPDVSSTCRFRSTQSAHRIRNRASFYIFFVFFSSICILCFDWWYGDRLVKVLLGVRPHRVADKLVACIRDPSAILHVCNWIDVWIIFCVPT